MSRKSLAAFSIAAIVLARTACAQEAGPIRVSTIVHGDGSRTVTKVDPSTHTTEASTYGTNNKLQSRIVYLIDDFGNWLESTAFAANGTPLYRSVYKRDQANRLSEILEYSLDDKLLRRTLYHYDAGGRVAAVEMFDGDGNPMRTAQPAPPAAAPTPAKSKKKK
jgi:hypothetical protein